jgi:glycosyltransferase involved in cell wall biosynthesis
VQGEFRVLPVVVPTYNGGQLLVDTLEALSDAIQKATSGEFLVAVFDDGSSDDSPTAAREVLSRRRVPHLVVCWHQNGGECANVNQAFSFLAQRGFEWVLLAHQDDILTADWLVNVQRAIRLASDDIAAISCRNVAFGEGEAAELGDVTSIGTAAGCASTIVYPGTRAGLEDFTRNYFWQPNGTAFRLSTFLGVGGFNAGMRWAGDTEFVVRFFLGGGGVLHFPEIAVGRRVHAGSSSSRVLRDGADAIGFGYLLYRHTARLDRRGALNAALRHGLVAGRDVVRSIVTGRFSDVSGRIVATVHYASCALAIASGSARVLTPSIRALIPSGESAAVAPLQVDEYADIRGMDVGAASDDQSPEAVMRVLGDLAARRVSLNLDGAKS